MTSSPPWRTGKRTDYTNTQQAKLKHTRIKETNTQRERKTRTVCIQGRQAGFSWAGQTWTISPRLNRLIETETGSP